MGRWSYVAGDGGVSENIFMRPVRQSARDAWSRSRRRQCRTMLSRDPGLAAFSNRTNLSLCFKLLPTTRPAGIRSCIVQIAVPSKRLEKAVILVLSRLMSTAIRLVLTLCVAAAMVMTFDRARRFQMVRAGRIECELPTSAMTHRHSILACEKLGLVREKAYKANFRLNVRQRCSESCKGE